MELRAYAKLARKTEYDTEGIHWTTIAGDRDQVEESLRGSRKTLQRRHERLEAFHQNELKTAQFLGSEDTPTERLTRKYLDTVQYAFDSAPPPSLVVHVVPRPGGIVTVTALVPRDAQAPG